MLAMDIEVAGMPYHHEMRLLLNVTNEPLRFEVCECFVFIAQQASKAAFMLLILMRGSHMTVGWNANDRKRIGV